LPFYRGRGGVAEGGVTAALMTLTPLKMGARLRGGWGIKGGVMVGQVTARAASRGVELGGAGSGGRRWRRGRARAEPEVRDDRWGLPVSWVRRGVKAAQLEALPCEEGGNRVGHHQRVAGWASREAEALWGEGGAASRGGKEVGHGWTEIGAGPNSSNKTFSNFYLEFQIFGNFGNLYQEI
jgi:hypothetical protein